MTRRACRLMADFLLWSLVCCLTSIVVISSTDRAVAAPHPTPWVSGIEVRSGTAPTEAKDAGNDLMFQAADTITVIPWAWQGTTKRNWRAIVTITATSGSTVWLRPFGPNYLNDQAAFRLTPAVADSANTWTSVCPIDSLWAWCPSGSAWLNGVCYPRSN